MLDIIIVSFNARADLERCLGSLHEAPPTTPHTIVVVDNASTDGSPDAVRRLRPDARLLPLGENVGFSRANNLGIRTTSGELVLLLNSDTIVPPGAIDGLVEGLRETPEAAVAGPRLVDGDGRPAVSFGRMVSPLAELQQKRFVHAVEAGRAGATRRLDRLLTSRRFVDWVSGACLLVWRADAEAVGALDERYFMYLEDVDFCAAIRRRGRRVLVVPEVTVTHLRGRSRRAAPEETGRAYRRSQLAFYEKHHPAWAPCLRLYLRLTGALPPG
jgi:GT2 family glycosyltransferase